MHWRDSFPVRDGRGNKASAATGEVKALVPECDGRDDEDMHERAKFAEESAR